MMSCFGLLIRGQPHHLYLFIRHVVITERVCSYQKLADFFVSSKRLLAKVSSSLSLIRLFYLVNFLTRRISIRCSKFFIELIMIEQFLYLKVVVYDIYF
jgi:hypothetical protein